MRNQRKEAIIELAIRHAREMDNLMEGGLGAAREKFKELLLWCPEDIKDAKLRAEWKKQGGKRGDLPFFSEMMLYELLGKSDARSLLARVREVGEALGFSSLEQHRDFEDPKENKDEYPSQDDLDALEVVLRDDADYLFRREPGTQINKLMRVLRLMRQIVGAESFTNGVQYLRVSPGDLRVGDRIAQGGDWVEVFGFFNQKGRVRKNPVEVRSKYDKDGEPYAACVKIAEDDTYGWHLRKGDRYIVQRRLEEKST